LGSVGFKGKQAQKLASRFLAFCLLTATVAVILGIILAIAIKPGTTNKKISLNSPMLDQIDSKPIRTIDMSFDLIR
jgi:Na+/H+-dicarboxylate symporter